MFTEGTLIAGKYRIDHVLGRGGMGVVAAATHVVLAQRVALKFLVPELKTNDHVVERFLREARAAAALRGEHICRVSDVGVLDDGLPYIVMELLEGTDLAQRLKAQGPSPVGEACHLVLQACVGVAEAHAAGIVHRDLKPANLFLARSPDGGQLVKVLDFGIAKAPGATTGEMSLTQTAGVIGSPGYMSPEQLRSSRSVDLRTDIWSLGVILFELVSGHAPFTADSVTELAIRVWMDPRPPLVGPLPGGFDQVIDRCLAKQPADRYPDLASLAHDLAAFAGPDGAALAGRVARTLRVAPGRPATTAPIAAAPDAPPATIRLPTLPSMTTLGASASSLGVATPRPARRWWVSAAVAGAIVVGVAVVSAVRRGEPAAPGRELAPPASAAAPPTPPRPAPDPSPPPAAPSAAAEPPTVAPPTEPPTVAPAEPPTVPGATDRGAGAAPADAGPVDAAPSPPDAAPPRRKQPKGRPASTGEDYGASRL